MRPSRPTTILLLLAAFGGCASAADLPKTGLATPSQRAAWRERLHWPASCEQAHEATDGERAGLFFHPFAPSVWIVEVACAAGAYQGSSVFVRWDESVRPPAAETLVFDVVDAPDGERLVRHEDSELSGRAHLDQAAGRLTLLALSRGPGDCGTRSIYDVRTRPPRLVEIRAKLACDGDASKPPEAWPIAAIPE